jgi:hypothetical protein
VHLRCCARKRHGADDVLQFSIVKQEAVGAGGISDLDTELLAVRREAGKVGDQCVHLRTLEVAQCLKYARTSRKGGRH